MGACATDSGATTHLLRGPAGASRASGGGASALGALVHTQALQRHGVVIWIATGPLRAPVDVRPADRVSGRIQVSPARSESIKVRARSAQATRLRLRRKLTYSAGSSAATSRCS